MNIKSEPFTLYDDASTREKEKVMNKWDILVDDERNMADKLGEDLEEFLEFGKTYIVTVTEVQ